MKYACMMHMIDIKALPVNRSCGPGCDGSILMGAVIFLFITGLMGFSFLAVASYEGQQVERAMSDVRAFWKGEEAISRAIAHINHDPAAGGKRETTISGGFRATYTIEHLLDKRYVRQRIVASVYLAGTNDSARMVDTAIVQAKTASSFFFLEDHADSVFYYTGDTIDGPVHTNTRFAIAGSPVFKGSLFESGHREPATPYVTTPMFSPSPLINAEQTWDAGDYPIGDLAGKLQSIPLQNQIRPPDGFTADIIIRGASYQLRYRNNESGTYSKATSFPIPASGGLYVHGDVNVQGELRGELTVGARDNIYIVNDIVYQGSNPQTGKPSAGSNHLLGLIAQKDVVVRQEIVKGEAPRGIRINAAIVAADESFKVDNYKSRFLGTMHLWGSIAQVKRGVVGAVMPGGRQVGYQKSWHYDSRLARHIPPFMPPLKDTKTGRTPYDQIYWSYK